LRAILPLIRAKRIVVNGRVRRQNDLAPDTEQKCQNPLHGTYLLWSNGLLRRMNGVYYLARRPWPDITPFPKQKTVAVPRRPTVREITRV
jgi:hypothetical protein